MFDTMSKNSMLHALLLILVGTFGFDACAVPCRVAQINDRPPGHFEVYVGAAFERGVALQLNFCSRVLVVAPGALSPPADHRAADPTAAEAPSRAVPV